jgi:hypothetical protein
VAAGLYQSGEAYSTSLREFGHDDEPSSLYTHLSLFDLVWSALPIIPSSWKVNCRPFHRTFPRPDFLGRLTWLARQPQRTSIPDSPGLANIELSINIDNPDDRQILRGRRAAICCRWLLLVYIRGNAIVGTLGVTLSSRLLHFEKR